MKKIVLVVLLTLVLVEVVNAGILIEGTYGLYNFSDKNFNMMFGDSASTTGIGIGYEIHHFNFIFSGKYLNKIERGVPSRYESDFMLFPVGFSVRYLVLKKGIQPYIGVGVTYNRYKKGIDAFGTIAEAGGYFRILPKFYLNIMVKANRLKFTPPGMTVQMKGISSEIGFTFK